MLIFGLDPEANEQGEYLVHRLGCQHYPNRHRVIRLGRQDDCEQALQVARAHREPVNGCWACIPTCHRRTNNEAG